MYYTQGISQTLKTTLIALILLISACSEESPQPKQLDAALKIHYLFIEEGKTGSARVRLRQFMEEQGESAGALFLMGFSYHKEKKYAKAVKWFTKSTSTDGEVYPPAFHFLGWGEYYLGDTGASKQAFQSFLELYPDEGDTLFALGLIATDEGDLASSQQYFERAIASGNTTEEVQAKSKARLADVFVERDEWSKAVELYEEALSHNPDLYEAWYRLSKVLLRMQKTDEAEKAFQEFQLSRRRVRPDLDQTTRFPE
jgi:tetratricopeptide (TPR) repeat protein